MQEALGELGAERDAPAPLFTLSARTNLPHHSPHKSSVGGKAWGTSRVRRTFCSLAAPPASLPNVLSYLASSRLNIFMFSKKFYWIFALLDLNDWEAPCVLPTFSWSPSQGNSQGERRFCFCSKSTKPAAVPGEHSVLPALVHGKEQGWLLNTALTSQLQEKVQLHCINTSSTKILALQ